jgi:hypothetical protein
VPLFAHGPGAEGLAGVRDNADIPRILADILGIDLMAAGREFEPRLQDTGNTE